MPLYTGFVQLGAGLSVGLAGLAAGFAIGIVGDAGVRGTAQQGRLFVGMVSSLHPSSLLCFDALLIPDPYPHFRRSFGSLRSYRCSYPPNQLWYRLHCKRFLFIAHLHTTTDRGLIITRVIPRVITLAWIVIF